MQKLIIAIIGEQIQQKIMSEVFLIQMKQRKGKGNKVAWKKVTEKRNRKKVTGKMTGYFDYYYNVLYLARFNKIVKAKVQMTSGQGSQWLSRVLHFSFMCNAPS